MARKAKAPPPVETLDIHRQKLTLDVRCGDCLFFKKAGVYNKESKNIDKSCEGFGTVSGSDPCRWFTADPRFFNGKLGPILKILNEVNRPQVLAAALLSVRRLRRMNFNLGQTVYFHVMGNDYLCNYASGIIVGAIKDVIVIESDGYIARVKPENVMDNEDWKNKLAELLEKDRINDPQSSLRKIRISNKARLKLYEPEPVKLPKPSRRKEKYEENGKVKTRIIMLTR